MTRAAASFGLRIWLRVSPKVPREFNGQRMIPKSGYRFSEKIMRQQSVERDDDSKNVVPL